MLNGEKLPIPEKDISFANVKESTVNDSGNLTYPQWFDIADLTLLGEENTITIGYKAGGCSFYLCGMRIGTAK